MNPGKVFLKPNVVIEPLVDRWYAWSHLISPATAAMNIVGRHLPIMESYIMAPDIHAEAVQNPQMKGGPFMDLDGDRTTEIAALKDETTVKRGNMILFAQAIRQLDELLRSEAKGFSMEQLYGKVPDILKGYVELFYDRNNNPGFRFFESLLYASEYYDKQAQSVALWITHNDHRPFSLSTPRLEEKDVLMLELPFDHPGIDELARMKKTPGTIASIAALLNIPGNKMELFSSFFTTAELPDYRRYDGDKIRMRYFGHACILIETKEVSILVDPLISYYGYQSDVAHYSDIDLPDTIDYVLITHNHQDHILFETLIPLRHRVKNFIVPRTSGGHLEDPNLRLMFNNIGFSNVIEIGEMESIKFADVVITGLPFTGEHSDLNIATKSCFKVQIDKFKLLFMADSRVIEPAIYEHVSKITGDIDVLFLGMECDGAPLSWLYGPLLTLKIPREQDTSRRLAGSDCAKGMSLVDIFKPRELYVYAMGQEPWLEFISSIKYTDESNPIVQSQQLIDQCRQRGIISERLYGEKELFYEKHNI
jgi:L-ascorbate metabolism protein UlaG (beta-lactamase superfamily)